MARNLKKLKWLSCLDGRDAITFSPVNQSYTSKLWASGSSCISYENSRFWSLWAKLIRCSMNCECLKLRLVSSKLLSHYLYMDAVFKSKFYYLGQVSKCHLCSKSCSLATLMAHHKQSWPSTSTSTSTSTIQIRYQFTNLYMNSSTSNKKTGYSA